MKRDKLLQHQLRRLDRLWQAKHIDMHTTGGRHWFGRFANAYSGAINRSLIRFASAL